MFGMELNAVLFESSARPVPSRPLPGVAPIPARGARLRGPRRAVMALAALAIGLFAITRQADNR
jgi:hypothetical protein